jgi:hypothetical protein
MNAMSAKTALYSPLSQGAASVRSTDAGMWMHAAGASCAARRATSPKQRRAPVAAEVTE